MMSQDLLYKIAMTQLTGIGPKSIKKLIAYCGSFEAFFKASKKQLSLIPGIRKTWLQQRDVSKAMQIAEKEITFIEQQGINVLCYLDEAYPNRLKHCEDGPVLLYGQGEVLLNNTKVVSVVGTRNISEYGKKVCETLITDLAPLNVLVVSGLAHGVDGLTHKLALKNKLPTVGVLGHGLDTMYPAAHKGLAQHMIAKGGGVLTEYLSGTKGAKEHFPMRNRIVAGMADGVVVVEAAKRGGALITAHIAHSYHRDVFAFPGRMGDVYSEGCNHLVKKNIAQLVTSGNDIVECLNWDLKPKPKNVQRQLDLALNDEERKLLDSLDVNEPLHIDQLAYIMQQAVSQLSLLLVELELKGLIKMLPGNRCVRY